MPTISHVPPMPTAIVLMREVDVHVIVTLVHGNPMVFSLLLPMHEDSTSILFVSF